ncbi:unnamed protein product, partial [Laminaria digitata]
GRSHCCHLRRRFRFFQVLTFACAYLPRPRCECYTHDTKKNKQARSCKNSHESTINHQSINQSIIISHTYEEVWVRLSFSFSHPPEDKLYLVPGIFFFVSSKHRSLIIDQSS